VVHLRAFQWGFICHASEILVGSRSNSRMRSPRPAVTFDWTAVVNWLTRECDQETNAARTSLPPKRKLVR
jgi:hypothetical protein